MGGPSVPDPNAAAVAGAKADLSNFPFESQINALAQMGGNATIGGKNYNFTGLGNAAQNAAISGQMAQTMLGLQQQYGPAYIQQRLADLQQSDPAGYAARQQLFSKVLADAQATPNRPLAADTQQQIMSLLGQGSNLSTGPGSETEAVQQGVRGQQLANGIFLGNAPASQEASALVNAGDQMQKERQNQAMSFLQSGVSPEDVTYRRVQQSLSNLGNVINGQSPEAEFASLSGAQNGAAPFNPGQVTSPTVNTGAPLMGEQNAANIYSGQVNWAKSQANPWTTGLSSLTGMAGVAGAMGWQPFGAASGTSFMNGNSGSTTSVPGATMVNVGGTMDMGAEP